MLLTDVKLGSFLLISDVPCEILFQTGYILLLLPIDLISVVVVLATGEDGEGDDLRAGAGGDDQDLPASLLHQHREPPQSPGIGS